MSAFVVEKEHIGYLVDSIQELINHNCYVGWEFNGQHKNTDNYTREEIGQILWNENVKSVMYRYDSPKDKLPCKIDDFPFVFNAPRRLWDLNALQVIQSVRCLEYQSCEHPGYQESEAQQIINAIIYAGVSYLLEENPQEWGFPKK